MKWPVMDSGRWRIPDFPILGTQPFSGPFTRLFDTPRISFEKLTGSSSVHFDTLCSRTKSSGTREVERALGEAAMKEVKASWLEEPFKNTKEVRTSGITANLTCRAGPSAIRNQNSSNRRSMLIKCQCRLCSMRKPLADGS